MNSPDDEMAQAFGVSPPWSIGPRTDLPNHWLSPARSLHLSTPQKQERRQFHTDLRQTEMSATIKLTHYCRLVRTTTTNPSVDMSPTSLRSALFLACSKPCMPMLHCSPTMAPFTACRTPIARANVAGSHTANC